MCVGIEIQDDLDPEDDEEFRVVLTTLDSHVVVITSFSIVTILNDDGMCIIHAQ